MRRPRGSQSPSPTSPGRRETDPRIVYQECHANMLPAQPSYSGDMLTLRRADANDSQILWLWRNDATTRAASLNTARVPWDDHERWFTAATNDPARAVLIALDAGGDRVG